ncbi:MAG: response regulator transcription factor [Acidobacteria bacterium]|nr:response regulator transcription factor [Acidobacteriota bacterium]
MSDPTCIKLLVVDDHPVVRAGLKALLIREPDLVVVGEAGSASEAVQVFRAVVPDVTLLDLHLPDADGVDVIRVIRKQRPGACVIILSSYAGDSDIRASLEAGAVGYILKDSPSHEICAAVRAVASGKTYVSRQVAGRLVESVRMVRPTVREQEVLELMVEGRANDQIAALLGVSIGTVKTHVHVILQKLGVADRTEAVAEAMRLGLVRSK